MLQYYRFGMEQARFLATSEALMVGNFTPYTADSLQTGRMVSIQHDWTTSPAATSLEGVSIIFRNSATNSKTIECIDATAISAGSSDGTIQTAGFAVKKTSNTTTAAANAVAVWPGYYSDTGTITTLSGIKVYGNSNSGVEAAADDGTVTAFYGVNIDSLTRATATLAVGLNITQPATGASFNYCTYFRRTGTTAPIFVLDGGTSGAVNITTPAAVTSWVLTLPPDDGDSGEQLQTNGSGVTTWEGAASTREVKVLHGVIDGEEALQRIRSAPVYRFHYDRNATRVGGDYDTEFVGIVADEAPWAMKHNGRIFNPINAFGHAAAAIQVLAEKLDEANRKLALLGV